MHDNQCRFDGAPGHYEVWYLTGNHRPSETGFWIRYTLESPLDGHGPAYAQLWFAHFDARDPARNVALNRKFPIAALSSTAQPFSVAIAGSHLAADRASGQLAGAGHAVSWDLRWIPATNTHRQLPSVMYRRGGLGETTVLTPNLDIAVRGSLTVDGRAFELAGEPAAQTHLWGRKHAFHWAWGHCNAFVGRPGAALEVLSVTLRRRGVTLPRLTVFALYLDGRVHRFNQFRHTLATGARISGCRFAFHGRSARWRVEGEYSCRPEDMVVAPYVDPDGEPSWCANTEVADLRVTVFERRGPFGWREHAQLIAPRCGHFEIGARQRDAGIIADHVTVEGPVD